MNENIKTILFKNLYTSILFQLVFLAIIVFAGYDIFKLAVSDELVNPYKYVADAIYALLGVAYFVCVYSGKVSMEKKAITTRVCIWILAMTFFIFQTFIL